MTPASRKKARPRGRLRRSLSGGADESARRPALNVRPGASAEHVPQRNVEIGIPEDEPGVEKATRLDTGGGEQQCVRHLAEKRAKRHGRNRQEGRPVQRSAERARQL
jgi:hypothetical protein